MSDYRVDRQRWNAMTIFEQMGKIGSEVGRTLKAQKANEDWQPALTRALDLFDATTEELTTQKSPRLREVLRAKEQFVSSVYGRPDSKIEDYFTQFAIAARLTR